MKVQILNPFVPQIIIVAATVGTTHTYTLELKDVTFGDQKDYKIDIVFNDDTPISHTSTLVVISANLSPGDLSTL